MWQYAVTSPVKDKANLNCQGTEMAIGLSTGKTPRGRKHTYATESDA